MRMSKGDRKENKKKEKEGERRRKKEKEVGEGNDIPLVLFTLLYFTLLYILRKAPGGFRASPRDDAGRFRFNQIGPKKRLTYETNTERTLSAWPTLENAP